MSSNYQHCLGGGGEDNLSQTIATIGRNRLQNYTFGDFVYVKDYEMKLINELMGKVVYALDTCTHCVPILLAGGVY